MATSNLAFKKKKRSAGYKSRAADLSGHVDSLHLRPANSQAVHRSSLARGIQSGSVSVLPRYMGVYGHVEEFSRALLVSKSFSLFILLFLLGATIGFSMGNFALFNNLSAAEFASYLYVDEISSAEEWL